jgi:thiamine pyrophosphokinase
MIKKTFLVIANGKINKRAIAKIQQYRFDSIVAADGGADRAIKLCLLPNVIIGDLDSLTENFAKTHPNTTIIKKTSQDLNDLEKVLIYCKDQGAQRIIAIGITGGRTDHILNNFSVLAKYCSHFDISIIEKKSTIKLVQKELLLQCERGQTISLIPLGKVEGIETKGLKYPLNNETLQLCVREGASNEATEDQVRIRVRKGTLLVFIAKVHNS